jgi:hypothetical protein
MRLKNGELGPFFKGAVERAKKGVFARRVKFGFIPAGIIFSSQPEPGHWYSFVYAFTRREKKFELCFGSNMWAGWQKAEALEQIFDMLKEKPEEKTKKEE